MKSENIGTILLQKRESLNYQPKKMNNVKNIAFIFTFIMFLGSD
jgi:hypothetical protein